MGVFAARRLVPGDLIMVEDPVLVTKFGPVTTPEHFDRMYADLHRQFKELGPTTQVRLLLSTTCV